MSSVSSPNSGGGGAADGPNIVDTLAATLGAGSNTGSATGILIDATDTIALASNADVRWSSNTTAGGLPDIRLARSGSLEIFEAYNSWAGDTILDSALVVSSPPKGGTGATYSDILAGRNIIIDTAAPFIGGLYPGIFAINRDTEATSYIQFYSYDNTQSFMQSAIGNFQIHVGLSGIESGSTASEKTNAIVITSALDKGPTIVLCNGPKTIINQIIGSSGLIQGSGRPIGWSSTISAGANPDIYLKRVGPGLLYTSGVHRANTIEVANEINPNALAISNSGIALIAFSVPRTSISATGWFGGLLVGPNSASGVKLVTDSNGGLLIRQAADAAAGHLTVQNLTVLGTQTGGGAAAANAFTTGIILRDEAAVSPNSGVLLRSNGAGQLRITSQGGAGGAPIHVSLINTASISMGAGPPNAITNEMLNLAGTSNTNMINLVARASAPQLTFNNDIDGFYGNNESVGFAYHSIDKWRTNATGLSMGSTPILMGSNTSHVDWSIHRSAIDTATISGNLTATGFVTPNSGLVIGPMSNSGVIITDNRNGGIILMGAGGTTVGTLQAAKRVVSNTGVDANPVQIAIGECGSVFTNEGAQQLNARRLPQCSGGLHYGFAVQNAYGMKIYAASGNTIRFDNLVTISSGFITSTTQGSYAKLLGINNTEWITESSMGFWQVQTTP